MNVNHHQTPSDWAWCHEKEQQSIVYDQIFTSHPSLSEEQFSINNRLLANS